MPTTQQLKADIDNSKTGDKNAEGFDLGLSTLGTDDEAAGSPNTPEQVALVCFLAAMVPEPSLALCCCPVSANACHPISWCSGAGCWPPP